MNGTKEKKAVWLKRFLNIGGMVAVTALLTWTYFCNPIDKKNYLFGDFEAVSEALVVGPIVAEHEGMEDPSVYGIGYYHGNTGDTSSYWTDTWSLYRGRTEYLTDDQYENGYGKAGDSLAFSANMYTREYYVPGNVLVFADGTQAEIKEAWEQENHLYVTVDAEGLNEARNGSLMQVHVQDAQGEALPQGSFSEYPSQYGLQGRVFQVLAHLFPYESAVTWLHLATAGALAVVITGILWLLNKKYGGLMAVVFGLVFWLSPWVVQFARNLYWVEFTWFLPMLFGLWCSIWPDSRRVRLISCLGVFASVFLKSACGYEFITTVMMGSILFLLADAAVCLTRREWKAFRRVLMNIFAIGIAALLGFAAALCMHADIRADGNVLEGIRSIYEKNFLERAFGGDPDNFPDSERESLEASVGETLVKYFRFDTHLIVGVSGDAFLWLIGLAAAAVVAGMWLNRRSRTGTEYLRLAYLLLFAFLTSISWFVLGKAHSYIHTHLNFVMWYFGFVQLILYIPIKAVWDGVRKVIKKQAVQA